uniref:LAGLIDADG homing endonuclease n=1 Tax=Termitomyces sp. TaxID=1916073 RepID=A0A386TYQ5_9AGAR|nr:LAGLIDADG homing endonuclease [Termitomyces sp.]
MLVSHLYRILKPSKLNNVVVLLLKIISLNYIGYALLISISASITTIYNLKITNGIVFKYLKKVKIFVSSYNPQITKARVINLNLHKSNITLNSGLSMRVGISEAIRMLFFSSLNLLFILVLSSQWLQIIKKQQKKFLILFQVLFTSISESKKEDYTANINLENLMPLITKSENLKSKSLAKGLEDTKFNQWLAGLIDGDGCFQLSKKGYASLEIVGHIRDKNCLYQIKQKFGGAVKLRTNLNHLRFRLHHKQGMLDIINAVNGEIRNPIRLLQLSKICEKYNIPVVQPTSITSENGWLSGFFDSEGSIYLNLKSSQIFITAGQKNKYLLDLICNLYGGSIYIEKTSFKWVVFRKSEIIKLLEYFKLNPCKSAKFNRIYAIPKYYELRDLKAHLAEESTILGKAWKKFLLRWDKWEKIK